MEQLQDIASFDSKKLFKFEQFQGLFLKNFRVENLQSENYIYKKLTL